MSIINTSSFTSDLLPLVKNWFGGSYNDYPTMYDKMVTVEQADAQAYQVDALMSGFSTLQQTDEGVPLTYDTARQEFTPRYVHVDYLLGFIITQNMMDDGIAMKNAKKFTEMFKKSAMDTREILVAQMFNRAFNSSYTMSGGDGVSLVSTSHPTRNGNVSNLLTGGSADISEAALEQATIDVKNMVNSRGLKIMLKPTKLICSVNDEPTANRILYSNLRVGTTDNDLNYLKANNKVPGGIIANPYLTDSDAWFLLTDVPDGLKFLNRKDPVIESDNDFDTKNAKFSVHMRCSVGWSDGARSLIGSAGA